MPASSEAFYDRVYRSGSGPSTGTNTKPPPFASFGQFRQAWQEAGGSAGGAAGAGAKRGAGPSGVGGDRDFFSAAAGGASLEAWRAAEARRRAQFATAEAQWQRFEGLAVAAVASARGAAGAPAQPRLRLSDVPFPTDKFELVVAAWTGDEKKAHFRKLMLRWHPDKWMQQYGDAIVAEEREAALERVTEVAKMVTTLRNG
jgi:hypothetical protein